MSETALTVATVRCSMPPRTGNSFTRSRASRIGAPSPSWAGDSDIGHLGHAGTSSVRSATTSTAARSSAKWQAER